MIKKDLNSKQKGDIGIGMAVATFTQRGWTVCIPLTDSQPYDLVVDMEGKLKRVSVKTTTQTNHAGKYVVELRRVSVSCKQVVTFYNSANADYLFVYANGTNYLIPNELITAKSMIVLGPKYSEHIC